MDASGSGSGGEKGKGKGNDEFEKGKQSWVEDKMKMFEKAFPMIQEDARLRKLIAAQYDAEEHSTWLRKFSRIDSYDDDDDSVSEREATQPQQRAPVQGQENAPDIATQQSQEMLKKQMQAHRMNK